MASRSVTGSAQRRRAAWRRLRCGVGIVGALALLPLTPVPAAAAPPPPVDPDADLPAATAAVPELPDAVPGDQRDATLGRDWDTSGDRAWLATGDAEGFHVMVADAAEGYAWRTVATLAESGFVADMWIGNACLTGSGERVAVTYAPRTFTNDEALFDRGGFTAIVELETGKVTKLDLNSSLAYYSPGCGISEEVLFSLEGGTAEDRRTRIVPVDARTAQQTAPIEVPGQLTSPVPTAAGIVAADDQALVRVGRDGERTPVVRTRGVAFELAADAEGGVVFLEKDGDRARAARMKPQQAKASPRAAVPAPAELGTGPLVGVGVGRSAGGQVHLTGEFAPSAALPRPVHDADVAKDADISVRGGAAVKPQRRAPALEPTAGGGQAVDPTAQVQDFAVEVESLATGRTTEVSARPSEGPLSASGTETMSPTLQAVTAAGSATDAAEAERTCAVPLHDVRNQAMQPKPRQVEWAVDQAVTNSLDVVRKANWKNLGMPSYTPQGLFPPIQLAGGGRVPAQIFLGILAQESNLWQAPGYVVPGVTGNPLIGNYYGLDLSNDSSTDDFDINWADADCGYGVAQVTDGMRMAGREGGKPAAMSYDKQRAVALDFAANIAAGLQILQAKWNQTYNAGMRLNNADPAKIENWFYAVWAYNSGFYPQSNAAANGGAWGLGWLNNPVNPKYPANRTPFLDVSYLDATHPQDWPYPEKVMGWAGHPIDSLESPNTRVAGFRAAWWNGGPTEGAKNRAAVKPPVTQFCDASNSCVPGGSYTPNAPDMIGEPAGPCAHKDSAGRYDLRCWYNKASTWKSDCSYSCGNELLRFDPGWDYQSDGNAYMPNCTPLPNAAAENWLPQGALIVDDVPNGTPMVREGCATPAPSAGTFNLTFGADANGRFPSKTDFHQIGAGWNGHFWFAHTREDGVRQNSMKVTGTWTLNRQLDQWARVMVHMPDHGAHTQQAVYTVDLGAGQPKQRVLLQRTERNKWVSLGVFRFSGTPKVTLTSTTWDGDGNRLDDRPDENVRYKNEDIAFDAVAFQPLAKKPDQIVVAMGDSYSSGEGASAAGGVDYYRETDVYGNDTRYKNACHRSPHAWSRQGTFAGSTATIGARADGWDPNLDYHLIACSGARTHNLLPEHTLNGRTQPENFFGRPSDQQYQDATQIDRGFLDENTTLVTLSIGGNDARFADVIAECVVKAVLLPCQWAELPAGDEENRPEGENVEQELRRIIPTKVRQSIVQALVEIRLAAPNAKIVLMGYPPLITDQSACVIGLAAEEIPFLNEMAALMTTHMRAAVADFNNDVGSTVARFSDPTDEFAGQAVCGNPETIHGIITGRTRGEESSLLPSQQSFHPKIAGQGNYARSFESTLREFGW